MFPTIIMGFAWLFLFLLEWFGSGTYNEYGEWVAMAVDYDSVNQSFLMAVPWIVGGVGVWFLIAYWCNASMIKHATGARTLERKENMRIYNIVENLCMGCGMNMPKLYIVDDPQLNAFASGINEKTYAVTLTTGIINRLNDEELAGVVGHELTHIRNRDTRLLITSIVFVGIVSTVMSIVIRMLYNTFIFGNSSNSRDNKNNGLGVALVLLIAIVCCALAYFFTLLTRFAISRKREYMADAGGAELCGNPLALASALRKISNDPGLQRCERDDVAQLFIVHPQSLTSGMMNVLSSMFSTHPDTEKRIQILEQF